MTDSNASQKAMEKIMKGEVAPRSRWRFVVQNTFLWILGFLSILAGAIVVSVIIFTLANSDMDLYREIYGYMVSRFTLTFVLLWILITGGFIALCDVAIRNTQRGYVYPLWLILVVDIFASVIIGFIFYTSGIGCMIDSTLGTYIAQYRDIEQRRVELFHKPEQGILMGRIIDVKEDYLEVATTNGDMWIVFIDELPECKSTQLTIGNQVVFAGQINDDHLFVACDVKIRNLYGITKELQKRQIEAIIHESQKQHDFLMQNVQQRSHENLCNGEIRWRIHIEQ